MADGYDYSQLSAQVGIALRRHIAAALEQGTPYEDAAIMASMAAMASPIAALAHAMGRQLPSEEQVRTLTAGILKTVGELPANQAVGGADASP